MTTHDQDEDPPTTAQPAPPTWKTPPAADVLASAGPAARAAINEVLKNSSLAAALRDHTSASIASKIGATHAAAGAIANIGAATTARIAALDGHLSTTKAAMEAFTNGAAHRILTADGVGVSAALSAATALHAAGLDPSGPLASAVQAAEAVHKASRAFSDITQGSLTKLVADGRLLGMDAGRSFISDATVTQLMRTPSPRNDQILSMAASMTQGRIPPFTTVVPGASAALSRVMQDTGVGIGAALARWQSSWRLSDAVQLHTTAVITELMRRYSWLADVGDLSARIALQMALYVRDAIVEHASDAIELVELFLLNFLDFDTVSYELIASAMLAIATVDAWLPAHGAPASFNPCKQLRTLTLHENRRSDKLLIDPRASQANYRSIASLNAPLPTNPDSTLLDALPAADDVDDEFTDPRLQAVDDKLTDHERRILRERGHERNWVDAAVACGVDPSVGEKLRRKVRRYGGLIDAAAGNTTAPNPPLDTVRAHA